MVNKGLVLLTHLLETETSSRSLLATKEIVSQLLVHLDIDNISIDDKDHQVSLMALLALEKFTLNNAAAVQLVAEIDGILIINKYLMSEKKDTKKAACSCLKQLIQDNYYN